MTADKMMELDETIEAWIRQNFTGRGVAVRLETEPPIPGEPLMSMVEAKALTRRAIAEFIRSSAVGAGAREALVEIAEACEKAAHPVRPEAEAIVYRKVNDEPFEYAIQQGPNGDEFVKLLNGTCLRRPMRVFK